MKPTNKDIVLNQLIKIDVLQQHLTNLNDIARLVGATEYRDAHGQLSIAIYQKMMAEWQRLLMWGLTLDDADRDRIKAAAYDSFLREGKSIAEYLTPDGTVGAYMAVNSEAFREMARKVFAPKVAE